MRPRWECCKDPEVPLGEFLPARACYKFARECCKNLEVPPGKFSPAHDWRECYKFARECCKDLEVPLGKFLPARECYKFIHDHTLGQFSRALA